MSIIPAGRMLKQEDYYEFQTSLDYRVRSYLKKQTNNKKKCSSQMYWSIIPTLERPLQED